MHAKKKVSMALWVIAFLMYLGGLMAMYSGGSFMNVSYMTWYWNALVLGVLVIGLKLGILIMLKSEK